MIAYIRSSSSIFRTPAGMAKDANHIFVMNRPFAQKDYSCLDLRMFASTFK